MIVVSSDWHLDAMTIGQPRFADVREKVEKVVDLARSFGDALTAFVFCGDLCNPDTPRAWHAVEFAVMVATVFREDEIPTLWLTGNHDVIADGDGSHVLQPLRYVARVADMPQPGAWHDTARNRMVRWLALPFTAPSRSYDPEKVVADTDGEIDIVFSHLNVEGIGPGSETTDFARGRQVFLPVDAIRAKWPHARIVQGHYHRPQVFNGIHVVGSLERFTAADIGDERGFIVLR